MFPNSQQERYDHGRRQPASLLFSEAMGETIRGLRQTVAGENFFKASRKFESYYIHMLYDCSWYLGLLTNSRLSDNH